MDLATTNHCIKASRWTLGLCAVMAALNFGLLTWAPSSAGVPLEALQFDRQAIINGELWRLVTGNLVHWSVEHFVLDVSVFLIVGILYERHFPRWYPWIMLGTAFAIGVALVLFVPEISVYRGLSGVDSGQFAAALCIELALARQQARRWLWLAPAAGIFVLKVIYESASGQMFFGTESLGDIGVPVALAHAAGAVAAGVLMVPLLCNRAGGLKLQPS